MRTDPFDRDSGNKPLKKFVKTNCDVISVDLDIDWDNSLQCSVDEGISRFYSIINEFIAKHVLIRILSGIETN